MMSVIETTRSWMWICSRHALCPAWPEFHALVSGLEFLFNGFIERCLESTSVCRWGEIQRLVTMTMSDHRSDKMASRLIRD